jgi:ectoine hydroxylase-related dioxygenase (phytanoyl-CoA dioxygenase family)
MRRTRQSDSWALSQQQATFYREHGYLAVEHFVDEDELTHLRAILSEMFAERAGRDRGYHLDLVGIDDDESPTVIPQILHPSRLVSELRGSQFLSKAKLIARQLLGRDAEFVLDHAILKPPHGEECTPWHQDAAFGDPRYESQSVSLWLPLQEATIANGCLHFIPHSHLGEVLPHRPAKNDPRLHALECFDGFDSAKAVACPLPAGGVSLHDSMLLHSAGPNHSDQPRFAYVAIFSTPARRRSTPREFPWRERRETAREEREQRWIAKTGPAGAFARWFDLKARRLTQKLLRWGRNWFQFIFRLPGKRLDTDSPLREKS